jgi:hypothetical protein
MIAGARQECTMNPSGRGAACLTAWTNAQTRQPDSAIKGGVACDAR